MTRYLIINKFSNNVIGGVETVVQNYARYSKTDIVWIASPDGETKNTQIIRGDTPNVVYLRFPSTFIIMGQHFSILFFLFVLFKCNRFSFVHHQSPFPLGALSLLLSLSAKKKIVTFHAPILNRGLIGNIMSSIEKLNMRCSDLIIYTSARLYRNYFVRPERCEILPIAISRCNKMQSTKHKSIRKTEREYLLYIGRVAPYKGIPLLIEAFSKSIARERFELLIVGKIDNRVQLEIRNSELPIVIHKDFVSECEKTQLIKNCYFGLLPSVNAGEAFGITQLEFMQHSKPVLNTALDTGVPEISLSNKTGMTCKPANLQSLLEVLDEITNLSNSRYENLSQNAKERFLNRFDEQIVSAQYNRLIMKIKMA